MIDLNKVREDVEWYKKICVAKNINIDVDFVLSMDDQRKKLQKEIDDLKCQQKKFGEEKKYEEAKALKWEIQEKDSQYQDLVKQLNSQLLKMPNTWLHPNVPIGKDESENVVVEVHGEPTKFDFDPTDHVTLMKNHDMIDIDRGVKLGWSRSYFLKWDWMLLEQAVLQYTLKKLVKKWFIPMMVPNIVNPECLRWTWYFPGWEEDAYWMERDDQWLIWTSEIPVTAYHMNEVLEESDLPKKYCGYSACFRREAWTYGKDTAWLYRVHQFNKVEQVVLIPADEEISNKYYFEILHNSMEILDDLKLPYRVLQLCSWDMAIWKYNSQDLKCWMPSRNSYGETHSVTAFLDFQARRLNLRYRDSEWKIKYCYTMNNTAIATPRVLISLIENYQTADWKIIVPDVLRDYMWKDIIG